MTSYQVREPEEKKNRERTARGRPRVSIRKSNLIGVRISPSLLAALEEFMLDQHEVISRPEAIRRLVGEWLATKRYLATRRGVSLQFGEQGGDQCDEKSDDHGQR